MTTSTEFVGAISRPCVSICIPVFNGEEYIEEAVQSILSQTWQDYELIVVDNASTDKTLEKIQMFQDSRLKIIRNKSNIGPVANFNKCLEVASGEFTKFLCADDLLFPLCVERQVMVLKDLANQNVVLVNCARQVIGADGKHWMVRRYGCVAERVPGRMAIRKTVRSGGNQIGEPTAVMLRTEVARKVGGFEEGQSLCMDLDLWCRMLKSGDLYVIPDVLCAFRVSRGSWSVGIGWAQTEAYHSFIQRRLLDDKTILTRSDRWRAIVYGALNGVGRMVFYQLLSALRCLEKKYIRNP